MTSTWLIFFNRGKLFDKLFAADSKQYREKPVSRFEINERDARDFVDGN